MRASKPPLGIAFFFPRAASKNSGQILEKEDNPSRATIAQQNQSVPTCLARINRLFFTSKSGCKFYRTYSKTNERKGKNISSQNEYSLEDDHFSIAHISHNFALG